MLTPVTSYLKLSLEPDCNDPSLYCAPSSVVDVELLRIVPSPIVFRVNAFVPVPSVPPARVNTSENVDPDPVSTVIELPAVPAIDAVNCNAVDVAVASTPTPAVSITVTKLVIPAAVSEPVAK